MEREALRGHALVIISTLAGIVGMGMMFSGAMHGNLHAMLQGAPFLLLGLWWAGRELGRSMMLSRSLRVQRRRVVGITSLGNGSGSRRRHDSLRVQQHTAGAQKRKSTT